MRRSRKTASQVPHPVVPYLILRTPAGKAGSAKDEFTSSTHQTAITVNTPLLSEPRQDNSKDVEVLAAQSQPKLAMELQSIDSEIAIACTSAWEKAQATASPR